jgi:hypothetical protein
MTKMNQAKDNEAATVKLQTLVSLQRLGTGMFGSVFLVRAPETGKLYALKCISKKQIVAQRLQQYLLVFLACFWVF